MSSRFSRLVGSLASACMTFVLLSLGDADAQQRSVPSSNSEIQLSFASVVKQVAPAVVNVYAERVVQTRSPFSNDPFFEFFFGRNSRGLPRQRVENSLGSGVIVGGDGIIVTNNHVIKGGDEFKVVLNDRREFKAEVVLADERTDLAVLRIDTKGQDLPALTFADSDRAEVGDLVLAIGNPFGVGQTVTSGIISAVARTQVGISDYQFFIQTDAAINPGNSGGALVTAAGDLVGVNTAIFTRSGGSIGIGFAIPANMVRLVVESATSGRNLVRPWFGIKGQAVTSELAESLDLDRPIGILVNDVYKNGPASEAGIKVGDVIISVDEFEIFDPQSFNYRLATRGIGQTVVIGYLRKGKEGTTDVRLAPPLEDPPRDVTELEGDHPLSGLKVGNLSPAYAEELGLDWSRVGVIVVDVNRASPAGRFGFRQGDIIESVNGAEISKVDDLVDLLDGRKPQWDISILRGDRTLNMTVRG